MYDADFSHFLLSLFLRNDFFGTAFVVFNNQKNTVNPKENIPVVGKRETLLKENLHESVLIHGLKPHLSNCNYSFLSFRQLKTTIERRNFFRWLSFCVLSPSINDCCRLFLIKRILKRTVMIKRFQKKKKNIDSVQSFGFVLSFLS